MYYEALKGTSYSEWIIPKFYYLGKTNFKNMKMMIGQGVPKVGSNQAFIKELYDEYFERLFLFAKSYVKSEDAAKDVVSEVFLSCWKSIHKLIFVKDIRSYLYTATKNESLRYLKKHFHQKSSIQLDEDAGQLKFAIEHYTPESVMLFEELQLLIEKTVQSMPQQCKTVYRLIKDDGLSHGEVAKVMGISQNTVKNHMVRALKLARIALEEYLHEESNMKSFQAKVVSMQIIFLFSATLKIFDFF